MIKVDRVVYKSLVPQQYLFELGFEGKMRAAQIYIINEAVKKELGASLVYTYDGKYWIRTSGGSYWKRGRHYYKFLTENVFNIIGVIEKDREKFRKFFFGGRK